MRSKQARGLLDRWSGKFRARARSRCWDWSLGLRRLRSRTDTGVPAWFLFLSGQKFFLVVNIGYAYRQQIIELVHVGGAGTCSLDRYPREWSDKHGKLFLYGA